MVPSPEKETFGWGFGSVALLCLLRACPRSQCFSSKVHGKRQSISSYLPYLCVTPKILSYPSQSIKTYSGGYNTMKNMQAGGFNQSEGNLVALRRIGFPVSTGTSHCSHESVFHYHWCGTVDSPRAAALSCCSYYCQRFGTSGSPHGYLQRSLALHGKSDWLCRCAGKEPVDFPSCEPY